MALSKITYTNKVALSPQPSIAAENKVTDSDMNQIKQVVNAGIDQIEENQTDITNIGTYSTNEVDTGKIWINGETIYRKVIDIGTLANSATATTYDTGLTFSQTKFIKIDIIAQSSGAAFSTPFVSQGDSTQNIEATIDSNGKVRIVTYKDRSAYTAIAILEYIKTI